MAKYELKLPNMGESVAEATLTSWLKKVGETINIDDAVLEVATDKVDSEVISEYSGVLEIQNFKEGDVVQVGQTIAIIETLSNEIEEEVATEEQEEIVFEKLVSNQEQEELITKVYSEQIHQEIEKAIEDVKIVSKPINTTDVQRFYSPLVKNIAIKEGLSLDELEKIIGTGSEGRVTKTDIIDYVASRHEIKSKVQAGSFTKKIVEENPIVTNEASIPKSVNGAHELVEMDRMRKLIAVHMRDSVDTSVHVQSFMEADVTDIWDWRQKTKDSFIQREGENLTFTPIFLLAIAKALRDYPMMNISVEGTTIIKKKNINIGMATALPSGNLIVPVIKNADALSLVGMVRAVNDLAKRAKSNTLKPDEVAEGTFTVTNIGSFGSLFGTPIINQPQVGILALGAIRKVPAVVETEQGDFIGIRNKMFITHAYDHRVVDGALGGMFLKRVVEYLEYWNEDKNCF